MLTIIRAIASVVCRGNQYHVSSRRNILAVYGSNVHAFAAMSALRGLPKAPPAKIATTMEATIVLEKNMMRLGGL